MSGLNIDAGTASQVVGWLDLLDVALGYVDEIRTRMNSGVPATKEEFTSLRELFTQEHDKVVADIAAMPDENSGGGTAGNALLG